MTFCLCGGLMHAISSLLREMRAAPAVPRRCARRGVLGRGAIGVRQPLAAYWRVGRNSYKNRQFRF